MYVCMYVWISRRIHFVIWQITATADLSESVFLTTSCSHRNKSFKNVDALSVISFSLQISQLKSTSKKILALILCEFYPKARISQSKLPTHLTNREAQAVLWSVEKHVGSS